MPPPLPSTMAGTATVGALRRRMAAELSACGCETAELDARLLLGHALGLDPADLLARADHPVEEQAEGLALALLARRRAGEPVARIRGRKEFWSLDFTLSPETLVPRPDTEAVVEEALARCPDRSAPLRILDLGTGSGAILAALLVERPCATGVGVDRSEGAVRAARDNLARAGLAARSFVVAGDWGEALRGGFDLVVSNPPYIAAGDMAGLPREVRLYDPVQALVAGADGLSAYRAIATSLPRLLVPGGVAVLELGAGQEPQVAALVTSAGMHILGPARRDLGGIARALPVTRQ